MIVRRFCLLRGDFKKEIQGEKKNHKKEKKRTKKIPVFEFILLKYN